MLKELRSLNLKLFSLRSFIVLSICLYYFIGMQISTAEDVTSGLLSHYKIIVISIVLSFFLIFFITHKRSIINRLSTRRAFLVLITWLFLAVIIQQPGLIFMLIIVLMFSEEDYKKMAGYLFIWISLLFMVFSTLSSFGMISSGEILKYDLTVDVSEYKSVIALGMGNPNTAMAFLLGAVMSGAYIFYDTKYRKRYGIIMFAVTFAVFSLTGSRTGFISLAIFLLLYLFGSFRTSLYLKVFMPLVVVALIMLSIFVGLRFGSTDNAVNDFLTTRPYQWSLRLNNGALTNFVGNSDTYITAIDRSERYPLDNQYIYFLARGGWLTLVVAIGLYLIGLKRIKSPVVVYMVLISLIQCAVESLMFNVVVNTGLIFLLSALLLHKLGKGQI